MATLVLTTIGTAIGGPLGGALGALIGQSIDARLFAPKGRHGPRLDELRVQTSSYGVPVPRLYGRMRVSGTVIWATDLVEHRNRQSNGKGRGSTTTYSYSLSMAVALSSRPIRSVGRIWAEGNLLRGGDGGFKSPVTFRLHQGDEDQAVDPLIAAAEGGAAAAFRGLAYAVLEDFDLSPFGNRLPSLTFEVEADADVDGGTLTLAGPVGDMLGHWQSVGVAPAISGCALAAETREGAIAPLAPLLEVSRAPGEAFWSLGRDAAAVPVVLGEATTGRREQNVAGDESVPQQIILSAYDPARDFQIGAQSARVAGGQGSVERIGLPLALAAEEAKRLAMDLAAEAAVRRESVSWPQGLAALALAPGARVTLPGRAAVLRIGERTIDGAGVLLSLAEDHATAFVPVAADAGRVAGAPDLAIGATQMALFDLPAVTEADRASGRLVLAAAGGPGWRGGFVRVRSDAGAPLVDVGAVGPVAVLGVVESTSLAGSCVLIDSHGAMVVQLHSAAMTLGNASDADLVAGANLAVAGGEVLQFGMAEPLGANRWRLTRLLRGRLGTEDAAGMQVAGDGFALLDDPALMALPPQVGLAALGVGGLVSVEGAGDAVPVERVVANIGRAARPLPPVHLRCEWQSDGGLVLGWTRRSRGGFGWSDAVDAPIDAREERYRVTWSAGALSDSAEPAMPMVALSASTVAALRAAGSTLSVSVVHIGDGALSLPLSRSIALI